MVIKPDQKPVSRCFHQCYFLVKHQSFDVILTGLVFSALKYLETILSLYLIVAYNTIRWVIRLNNIIKKKNNNHLIGSIVSIYYF